MKKHILKAVNILIILVILYLTFTFLAKIFHSLSWEEVKSAVLLIDSKMITLVAILTALNYFIVTFYDLITVKQIKLKIPYKKVFLYSLTSFILNNNLGFGAIMGGALRFRYLTKIGMSPILITNYMILFSWIYWLGLIALSFVVFLFIEPGYSLSLPFIHFTIQAKLLGLVALIIVLIFFILSFLKQKKIISGAILYPIAKPKILLLQFTISTLDWLLLGLIFYFLLPNHSIGFFKYLPIYLVSQITAVSSHVPGGTGVFDGIMIFYLKNYYEVNALVGSLFIFRLVYFLIPLAFGILLFFFNEFYLSKNNYRIISIEK
ncbi:conserved hypothetical protein [Deferribacter desulfuricans SSM1]|uniref:Uncharacterized protein n=1 Tax=Deferribacter desulfuricans (strain DSM 14783 / JCM 11476 / NBRC 101012 / SSM1) TaxID=639282 RepID=D3PC84_DEFDS|nr:lysylphosphatidylglycerol synthase domain-containing protein [Deferribacter desulfuricans]BAI80207.1 conserved hypothetical protein [Deferribacter desulfuricans SSM1]